MAPRNSGNRGARRVLIGECLEPRWTPAWSGVPPTAITPPASAVPVAFDTQNDSAGQASIASTEIDYYAFTAPVAGSYTLSATTPSSNLDTVLGLFSATGQRLTYNDDVAYPNTDSRVTVNLTAGTRYYVGITNYTGSAAGSYTWTIDGPAPTTAAPTDDAYEENDSFATAGSLGTLSGQSKINSLVMADSADWYKFTTTGTGTSANYVSISFLNSQGDLDLELYNSAGSLVSRSQSVSNVESLSMSGLAAGTYYVRVYGYLGAKNSNYSLDINPGVVSTTPTVDLAGASLSVTNSSQWGQTITVNAAVRNSGNTATGAFAEQWYLSRDAVGSSDDILLSRTNNAGSSLGVSGLAAGSTSSTLTATLQLPTALPAGWSGTSFYLVMRTDAASQVTETNESNNFGQAGSGIDNAPITIGGTTPTGGFQITLNMTGLTASQQAIFQQAANRWAQVITGDLPNASYQGRAVDDLLIDASAAAIDGVNGVLGQAGPDAFRSGTVLPYHGSMEFDSADLASMESSGLLLSVVMHEMGHILGIGTLWDAKGLLRGAGTSNPTFTGSQAVAAYNQIFGTNATGVPVESTGGAGTANSHWRETTFSTELMTGWAGPGTNLPLSRVTVASLADLGYQVNLAAADTYTPSASAVAAARTTTASNGTSSIVGLLNPQTVDAVMAALAGNNETGNSSGSRLRHACN